MRRRAQPYDAGPMTRRIVLDTDIGDDVDDALALALVCGSPELELVAVTTVYGNVAARSRQARTILKLAGRPDVPVAAGCGASLSTRAPWGAERYLGDALPRQDKTSFSEADLPPQDDRHAVTVLIEALAGGDGDVVPVTIGAMTNLAVALTVERRIAAKIPKVVCMAGEFRRGFAEYNIRCDPEAAAIVVESGLPIDFTPWSIGWAVRLTDDEVERIGSSSRPVARNLREAIDEWRSRDDSQPALYDPMAVAGMIDEGLFTWRRGRVRVETQGSATYGFTTFTEDPDGPHRIAWEADRDRCAAFFLHRILSV